MTVADHCPDRASLQSLLDQGADANEVERLAAHLETCARCGDLVETLLAADRTVASLRGVRVEADTPSVQLLRERIANLRPAAVSPDTTAGENTQSDVPLPASFEAAIDDTVSLAPPQRPDEIGRLGGYRVLKELGRGGMGMVFQAEDVKLKRLVALKVMLPRLAADASAHRRFLREAQAMAAVHHDHVVTIHAVDEDNGVPFLAMEFLNGTPLDKWLKDGRKPDLAQTLRVGREIAEGLVAAHGRGLIHRDIKPGNIWLDSDHKGRVKILDFGLARVGTEDVHLTRTGAVVGTPAYMSPEQAAGQKVDARTDLFSLGCILYRFCTGAMPFSGDTTMALLTNLAISDPRPVRELNPDTPPALAELVMRLLAKKPADRPASAREVAEALQAIERDASDDRTVQLPAGESPAAGGKRRRLWPWAAAAGLLGAAVVVIIIIRDSHGNKVGEIKTQPGYTVDVVAENKPDATAKPVFPPPDEAWAKKVRALSPEKQVEEVAAEMKRRNPGFDGKMTPLFHGNTVSQLDIATDDVADLTPLAALPGLASLSVVGLDRAKNRLMDLSPIKNLKLSILSCNTTAISDLSPLQEMPLARLSCWQTRVSDLTPLKGMLLESLNLGASEVSDLSPLKGLPLRELQIGGTHVSDLSALRGLPLTDLDCGNLPISELTPLKGMKLSGLSCRYSRVSDLSPLEGMPLTNLVCNHAPITDLSPLKGMKLTRLVCHVTRVGDLSPLAGMLLKELTCDFKPGRDVAILRSIKTLELINGKSVAEFWKEVDAKAALGKP